MGYCSDIGISLLKKDFLSLQKQAEAKLDKCAYTNFCILLQNARIQQSSGRIFLTSLETEQFVSLVLENEKWYTDSLPEISFIHKFLYELQAPKDYIEIGEDFEHNVVHFCDIGKINLIRKIDFAE